MTLREKWGIPWTDNCSRMLLYTTSIKFCFVECAIKYSKYQKEVITVPNVASVVGKGGMSRIFYFPELDNPS